MPTAWSLSNAHLSIAIRTNRPANLFALRAKVQEATARVVTVTLISNVLQVFATITNAWHSAQYLRMLNLASAAKTLPIKTVAYANLIPNAFLNSAIKDFALLNAAKAYLWGVLMITAFVLLIRNASQTNANKTNV